MEKAEAHEPTQQRYAEGQAGANYRLILEVRQEVERIADVLGTRGFKMATRRGAQKPSKEFVAEALLCRVLSLPWDELEQFLKDGLEIQRGHLAKEVSFAFKPKPLASVARPGKRITTPRPVGAESSSDGPLPVRPRRKGPRGERKAVGKNSRIVSPH